MKDRKGTLTRRDFMRLGGLTAVAAGTVGCAAVTRQEQVAQAETPNPFDQLVDTITPPRYTPSLERQSINLDSIPLIYPETAQGAANQLRADLFRFKDLLTEQREDPIINPRLGGLFWQQTAGGFDFLNENTLLEIVTNSCNDIENGLLLIEPTSEGSIGFMYNNQNTHSANGRAYVSTSTIRIPEQSLTQTDVNGSLYSVSNIQLLVTGLYEYTSRMSYVGLIAQLNSVWYSETNPALTDDQVYQDVEMFKDALFNKGYRRSADQNIVQFAAARSLAALAGDENARLVGLEFLEEVGIYPNYIAALNGDSQAMVQLQYDLSVRAAY